MRRRLWEGEGTVRRSLRGRLWEGQGRGGAGREQERAGGGTGEGGGVRGRGGVQGRVLKRFFGDRGEVLSIARALTLEEVRRT